MQSPLQRRMMERQGFWVFGYGSLMWKPGFEYAERRLARLKGYRRAFCLKSIHYRGTEEVPGLVLGLDWDPGAVCTGAAFRVLPEHESEVRDYLAERELISRSYFEVLYPVELLCEGRDTAFGKGETVDAICYVMDRSHEQYWRMPLDKQAAIIACASGDMGPNCEYLHNTAAHLAEMGIEDPEITELDRLVRACKAD